MIKQKVVNLKIKYNSNFKIHNNLFKNKIKLKNNKIFCKNFIFFIILLKYYCKKDFFLTTLFLNKKNKKSYTLLRPPYRHKLSRHQFSINRFNLFLNIFIKMNNKITINKTSNLHIFINYIKIFFF